jgi:diadenosine tetraphosphatase ApaH/serine/threonine PP2A family protein phosphatase
MIQNGVNDQHVRELQGEGRVGYGRAEAADQVRGSLALPIHGRTVRLYWRDDRGNVSVVAWQAVCWAAGSIGRRRWGHPGTRYSIRKLEVGVLGREFRAAIGTSMASRLVTREDKGKGGRDMVK